MQGPLQETYIFHRQGMWEGVKKGDEKGNTIVPVVKAPLRERPIFNMPIHADILVFCPVIRANFVRLLT